MGGKAPPRPGGTQDHPVSTVAAERGCGVDCKASKATSRNRVVLRRRRMTGPSRAARRPQADPAREAPTGAECKPVGRAGQAQPDRKVTSGKCRYRGNLPESLSGECIKTAPKSRAGFEHENAAKLAFLGLKKATISWLQAPRNAADLRACARSKDVGFSCRTVLRHDTRGQNPIPDEPVYLLKGRR